MGKRKILLILVIIFLVVGGFLAWYLYNQSIKISKVTEPVQIEKQQQEEPVQQEDKEQEAQPEKEQTEKPVEFNATKPEKQAEVQEPEAAETAEEQNEGQIRKEEGKISTWASDLIVTPYFIHDLAEYVVSRYYPAGSQDNPGRRGVVRLDFKSLNARYGLELIGLRYSSHTLKEARKEVLQGLMDEEQIMRTYDRYAGDFLNEVIKVAETAKRKYKKAGNEPVIRPLNNSEIVEMLDLIGLYIQEVSKIISAMARDKSLDELVGTYLQAAEDAVHANYMLNQIQNDANMLENEYEQKNGNQTLRNKIEYLEQEKKQAINEYKQAIQKREKYRSLFIQGVEERVGELSLKNHEILYIAEWVHRRLSEREQEDASNLELTGELLGDLADKFTNKADTMAEAG